MPQIKKNLMIIGLNMRYLIKSKFDVCLFASQLLLTFE